jgi:hypothetical protein
MTQEYQLRILPEIAANEQKLKEYLSKEKGLNLRDITATRILKRSIDARQRTIFVNLKVRAYIKEMKTEMDEYLGRGDNPERDKKRALVLKHLRRHRWVTEHINEVAKHIGVAVTPRVKSMMLTATVIPTSYLKREKIPMSILNYPELKIKGVNLLDSCKEPDLSVLDI